MLFTPHCLVLLASVLLLLCFDLHLVRPRTVVFAVVLFCHLGHAISFRLRQTSRLNHDANLVGLPSRLVLRRPVQDPFGSMLKVTSISGAPRGADVIPSKRNFLKRCLSIVLAHSPLNVWIRTPGWLPVCTPAMCSSVRVAHDIEGQLSSLRQFVPKSSGRQCRRFAHSRDREFVLDLWAGSPLHFPPEFGELERQASVPMCAVANTLW